MAGGEKEKLHSQWASLPVHNGLRFSMKLHFRSTKLPRNPLEMRLCGQVGISKLFFSILGNKLGLGDLCLSQCPRTDLSKMFLPKPMTTTG